MTFRSSFISLFIVFLAFLLPDKWLSDQQRPVLTPASKFTAENLIGTKERLTFEAHYLGLRLGEITVEQFRDTLYDGRKLRLLRTVVKSNPRLLFVGYKEEQFHSVVDHDANTVFDLYYWKDDVDDKKFGEEHYRFDYDAGHVLTWKFDEPADTLAVEEPSVCGPAVLYRTRLLAGTGNSVKVPIYINQKHHFIEMTDHRRVETIANTAFGNETEQAWYVDGNAAFDGPFGFNGNFKGWLLKDQHMNVPLEGHVKVWIGNIKVRLVKYEIL